MCVCVCVFLLLIVVFAVQQAVPAVTGPGQRAQTHGALDAGLVPGALVHAQQEAVCDGRLAAGAHLSPSAVLRTCGSISMRGQTDRQTDRGRAECLKSLGS